MERSNAVTVKYNELIEDNVACQDSIVECPQLGERVLWLSDPQTWIIHLEPDIICNFICYFDNGEEEIEVINNEYTEYDPNDLYMYRTGKYDTEVFIPE